MIAEHPTNPLADRPPVNLARFSSAAGLLGAILIVILLVVAMSAGPKDQPVYLGSYLYGLTFWTAITLGMFVLTVLNHTVRSTWTLSVLRILEAGGGWINLAFLGVLFIPIAAKLPVLYSWADAAVVAKDPTIQHKVAYLNPGFWTIRIVVFFLIWSFFAWFFRNSAMRQEKTKDFQLENGRMSWGAAMMVVSAVTGTFFFIDVVMSLEPHWYSTMYGLWFMIGSSLGAYSLAVVIFNLNSDREPYASFVTKNVLKDQGNMLFVHTMLWGYTSLSQYLILWNGNLPETTSYYVRRASFGWNVLGMATIIGQFFIPFFLLLSPRTKKNSPNMRAIAGFMFGVHVIDYTLIVAPALPGRAGGPTGLVWTDALSLLAFGAVWLFGFSLMAAKAAPFPTYDTRLQEAKAHAH